MSTKPESNAKKVWRRVLWQIIKKQLLTLFYILYEIKKKKNIYPLDVYLKHFENRLKV